MSCKIERVNGDDLVVLRISGWLTGEHVEILRELLQQDGSAVAIDLKEVLLVDRDAVKLLAVSEINGADLRNCHAYIREWVAREKAQISENRPPN